MKYFCRYFLILTALGALFCSCGGGHNGGISGEAGEPEFLRIADRAEGGWTIVSVSPFDGSADTLVVDKPMTNIIVMSTSHYGFLDAIGHTDIISGISGPDYLWINSEQKTAEASSGGSTASLRKESGLAEPAAAGDSERSDAGSLRGTPLSPPGGRRGVDRRQPTSAPADVGYDSAPDYETIVALRPEVVLTYAVSGVESPFVGRLKQLGIRVLTVNEHLERHPLARAAYIRLFGALSGDMAAADSVLSVVKSNYEAITKEVISRRESPRKVLLNIL